jgi:hypothetical protein
LGSHNDLDCHHSIHQPLKSLLLQRFQGVNGYVSTVKGIQYLVDESGNKTAVQLDLTLYGEIWEDIYDSLIAENRKDEPRETLDEVKQHLHTQEHLSDNG